MYMLGTAGKCCLDDCHPTLQNTTAKGNENEKQNKNLQNLRNQLFSNTQTTASLDHLSVGVPRLAELHGMLCLKLWKVEQKDAKPKTSWARPRQMHPFPISTKLNWVNQGCPAVIPLYIFVTKPAELPI